MPYNHTEYMRKWRADRRAKRAAAIGAAPGKSPTRTEQLRATVQEGQRALLAEHALKPGPGIRIAVIPDCQVKPDVPLEHLAWCGEYLKRKRPDVIVCIGDFADMPSLSSYDKGTRAFEGRRYRKDIDIVIRAMSMLVEPWQRAAGWSPRLVLTLGNHEHRIHRVCNEDARLEGTLSVDDLGYKEMGWEVVPFLQPIVIEGVSFCHYFPSGVMGRPITSARALLTKMHMSAFAGHQQGREIAYGRRADGRDMTAIISGSFYQHDEDYLNPYTNGHWRGMYMLHEVRDGSFDEMAVSLNFLKRKFG